MDKNKILENVMRYKTTMSNLLGWKKSKTVQTGHAQSALRVIKGNNFTYKIEKIGGDKHA